MSLFEKYLNQSVTEINEVSNENTQIISALKNFASAVKNLSEVNWDILNKTESINDFPFDKSFDEIAYEVSDWVPKAISELKGE